MNVVAQTNRQIAPALVHRKPVQGGLVLSTAGLYSAASGSCYLRHRDGGVRRCDLRAAAPGAIVASPNANHRPTRCVDSP